MRKRDLLWLWAAGLIWPVLLTGGGCKREEAILAVAAHAQPASAARAASAVSRDDLGKLPPDGFGPGWRASRTARVFTSADLYGHIDGGAELFFEFGFEQLTVQRYRKGSDEFSVEIYRMTDPEAALGVYLMKCGRESRAKSFAERHTAGPYQLMFVRERYYVVVNNHEGRERLLGDLVRFGEFVAERTPAGTSSPTAEALPGEGLKAGSTRLIRGHYALQSVFSLGEGNILSLRPRQTAAAGDYAVAGREFTLILCRYPDEVAANKAYEHLASHLDPYLKVLRRVQDRLTFRDFAEEYGDVIRRGAALEIRVHLAEPPKP